VCGLCEAELGNFEDSINFASLAYNEEFQFTLFGGYHYYSALVKAHNQLCRRKMIMS